MYMQQSAAFYVMQLRAEAEMLGGVLCFTCKSIGQYNILSLSIIVLKVSFCNYLYLCLIVYDMLVAFDN